ncbi:MAG: hypothetical protein V4562_02540 [Pseudomonadota bacterium]
MNFRTHSIAVVALALATAFAAQAQAPDLSLQFISDADKAKFNARSAGCSVDIVKLPEQKIVAVVIDSKSAMVKLGKATTEQFVYFRNTKEVKFGGLTIASGGDFVVEASLVKNGEEALCEPIGCRAIPARMLLDVSSREGKNRVIDSNVVIQDKCGRLEAKRLLN